MTHLVMLTAQPSTADAESRGEEINGAAGCPDQGELDPTNELISTGAGRRRLADAIGVSEHEARKLIAERRNGVAR